MILLQCVSLQILLQLIQLPLLLLLPLLKQFKAWKTLCVYEIECTKNGSSGKKKKIKQKENPKDEIEGQKEDDEK